MTHRKLKAVFLLAALSLTLMTGLWFLLAWCLPFPDRLLRQRPENGVLTDVNGEILRRVLSVEGLDAEWLPLAEAGDWAAKALVSVEDQRFFTHGGVDFVAVLRAAGQNLSGGRVVSGASTLSTQLIRLIEPRPRTVASKVMEAFRATQLEMRHDKDFILEQYLNRAPFGGNRQGLATAAARYYGKSPADLSAGEAALLMGLPQSPSRYRPDRHPQRAEARRETVLRRMREEGVLSGELLLERGPRWVAPPGLAPHFTDTLLRSGGPVRGTRQTTLDLRVQRLLETVAQQVRDAPLYADVDGIALLALDARSGSVLGWVGGMDVSDPRHGQVDAVTRRRAPGSTLKPFAFALAMQQGWLTPDTLLDDSPRSYRDYHPRNMDRSSDGEVSATDALVRSLNLPALAIAERLGPAAFLNHLRQLGFELPGVRAEDTGLGAVIGGGLSVSLLELTRAYRSFAVDSSLDTPHSPAVAWWISSMLSAPERDAILYGHAGDTGLPRVAFKTGTSHGHRDAWAVGWNRDVVVGIWVGRMDNAGVRGLTGATHAAPLLGAVARELMAEDAFPVKPPSIVTWQGREIIEGVSDPSPPRRAAAAGLRIVSPTPQLELHRLDAGAVHLRLQAAGAEEQPVHWFVNGIWQAEAPPRRALTVALTEGEHRIRVVDAEGRSAETRVRIF